MTHTTCTTSAPHVFSRTRDYKHHASRTYLLVAPSCKYDVHSRTLARSLVPGTTTIPTAGGVFHVLLEQAGNPVVESENESVLVVVVVQRQT